jgi:hypothetical protein
MPCRCRAPSLRAPLLLFAILRNGLLEMSVVDRWELMGVAILRNGLTPRPRAAPSKCSALSAMIHMKQQSKRCDADTGP